jgi:hypothetical protein
MNKLLIAALCCATSAVPAMAQVGHVHGIDCNHQFTESQGALQTGGLNAVVKSQSGGGMKFILNNLGGVEEGTDAFKGFQAAAAIFSKYFTDDVTIRLDVRFSQLGAGILGSTGSTTNTISYAGLKTLMAADAKSVFDNKAVGTLQGGAALAFVSNEAGNCTVIANPSCQAISSTSRTLDNDNTFDNLNININTAQVKALGLNPVYNANTNPGGRDGSVSFSNQFNWDFDRSDGIDADKIDFVGVAAHEIGHALGFRSGVDTADVNADLNRAGLDNIAWGTVHDLFRYKSFDGKPTLDWTIGGAACYSINAGQNCLALLSTGRNKGDGRQASHWKDDTLTGNLIGLMDPTASGPGGVRPFQAFTKFDAIAFDAMGYDLAVPEPATWAMMISGFGFVGAAMRRRRRIAVSFA